MFKAANCHCLKYVLQVEIMLCTLEANQKANLPDETANFQQLQKLTTYYCIKLYVNLNFLGIMNIKMYPYGNAHEEKLPNGHYAYLCQHGDKECRGKYVL